MLLLFKKNKSRSLKAEKIPIVYKAPAKGGMLMDKNVTVDNNYKDSVFRMIFREREALLSLYNAVNDTEYDDSDELKITTLENAVFLGIKNDISCLIDMRLSLFEHQSTVNPNMPFRYLKYVSAQLERDYSGKKEYGHKRITLPRPSFVTFYNGTEKQPERVEFKLSDLYERTSGNEEINLELICVQLNINTGYNEKLKESCKLLAEYVEFVNRVRGNKKIYKTTEEAVKAAVDECIRDGILADFLRRNKAMVYMKSLYEFDEEGYKEVIREESYEDGFSDGRREQREADEAEMRQYREQNERYKEEIEHLKSQLAALV